MSEQVLAIYALMIDVVSELWLIPAFIIAGFSILALVLAVRRGAGV